KRPVKVGYVVKRPIWKTSYRLLIEPNGKLFLQGWAIVENTSDDDWNNVRMVLISGRPIAFKMNLYEPLWIPRPTVEPELFASRRPPVYSGSLDEREHAKGKKKIDEASKAQEEAEKKLEKGPNPTEPMRDSMIATQGGKGRVDAAKIRRY